MITEQARSDVYLNGQQAGQELEKLAKNAEKLKKEMYEMRKANDKAGFDKKQKELRGVNKEMKNLEKQAFDVNQVLKNLKSTSLNDLYKAQRTLNREMRKLPQNSKEFQQMQKDSQKLSTQINKVKMSMKGTNSAISASGKLWNNLKSMLPIAGLASIVGLLGRFGKGLLDLKREMDGDAKRAAIVFGDQLGYVQSQAEKLAEKMGLTNQQFIAVAASTADLLVPLGFTREQAAKMSVDLQGLVGALDEWTGGQVGAKEVSNILTKAMLGENEQLKQLGIAIRMDSEEYKTLVKQKMETNTVTKAQAQAMATLELIQMKSLDAQRAYITEGNRLLRFQKEASRQWRELRENIVSRFDVPAAKLMEEEANKANLLTAKLMNTNIEEDKRKEIFNEMKKLYPDILKGIDQENISTKKLVDNLAAYNLEKGKEMVMAQLEEEQQAIIVKQAEERSKLIDTQTNAVMKLNSASAYLSQKGVSDDVLKNFDELREIVWGSDAKAVDSGRVKTLLDIIVEKSKEAGMQSGVTADLLRTQFLAFIPSIDKAGNALRSNIDKNKDALQTLADAQELIMEALDKKTTEIIEGNPEDDQKIKDKAAYQAYLYQKKIKEEILKRKKVEGGPIDWIFDEEENLPDDLPWLDDWYNDRLDHIKNSTNTFWKEQGEGFLYPEKLSLRTADSFIETNKKRIDQLKILYAEGVEDVEALGSAMEKEEARQEEIKNNLVARFEELKVKYMAFANDAVTSMVNSWDERKQAEEDYNKSVEKLNKDYENGRMSVERYEQSLTDLKEERREQEIQDEKNRGKALLGVLLDYLHKYLIAKIAQITIGSMATLDSIATAGVAGVAKAAILTAAVETAFQVAKAKISQNYEGRYPVIGAQDNRTYFATGSGDATTGVYSSPTLVAERGTEMIIDNPTLSNISMNRPDIIRDIQSLRVPQYAEGRMPASASSATSMPEFQEMKQMVNLLRSIESALLSGKVAAVVGDYQVRELRNRMDKINSIEKSVSK